jgi:hypothetical protein
MAVAGILSSSIFDILNQVSGQHNAHDKFQQIKQRFQQLGSDLQSGNLSQAQTNFAALQQNLPNAAQSSAAAPQTSSVTANSLTAAVNQPAFSWKELKAGNLSAVQSDFAAVQQDVQALGQQQAVGGAHHHHPYHASGSDSSSQSSQQDVLYALFNQLGSALHSGNLSTAQQAYSTLQQDFQQFTLGNPFTTSSVSLTGPAASSSLNLSAWPSILFREPVTVARASPFPFVLPPSWPSPSW